MCGVSVVSQNVVILEKKESVTSSMDRFFPHVCGHVCTPNDLLIVLHLQLSSRVAKTRQVYQRTAMFLVSDEAGHGAIPGLGDAPPIVFMLQGGIEVSHMERFGRRCSHGVGC